MWNIIYIRGSEIENIYSIQFPHERKGCFMATVVRGKNLEITSALKDHVLKQEKKVTKYFDNEVNVQALLSLEKDLKIAEITVKVDGVFLRGV